MSQKPEDYPRPDRRRDPWFSLNGEWEFQFDPGNPVDGDGYVLEDAVYACQIRVPFPYQSSLSGIRGGVRSEWIWYRRRFDLPSSWPEQRALLWFGAVDYRTSVWLNGQMLGTHTGGYTPFSFDITHFLRDSDNTIVVRVEDSDSREQPRGKQSWASPFTCWYTPVSGIWQTVWIESVGDTFIRDLTVRTESTTRPLTDEADCVVELSLSAPLDGATVTVDLTEDGNTVNSQVVAAQFPTTLVRFRLSSPRLWGLDDPFLYGLSARLSVESEELDRVESYAGLRTVAMGADGLRINGETVYQRLVLDQGYWPDGLYTAPTADAIKSDIELAKELGFNGCRKHMKVEDPRFHYWADRLGFLVWVEFPAPFEFTERSRLAVLTEWTDTIRRDLNHPAIVAWVPYNESWGLDTKKRPLEVAEWLKTVVALTRWLDPSRIVVDNDGWEHVDTDLATYHTYAETGADLKRVHESFLNDGALSGRKLWLDGQIPRPLPVVVSEFGGVAVSEAESPEDSWGYNRIARDETELKERIEDLFRAVHELPGVVGFCYTQLADVGQETNGLLRSDRTFRLDPDWVRSVVTGDRFRSKC